MLRFLARLLCVSLAVIFLIAPVACSHHEHKKVRVIHEQHEGEVKEVEPGEMIVE